MIDLERSEFDDIVLSDIVFAGAQKYKVADDSFYVEAKYIAVVRYSHTTTPFTPMWLTNTPVIAGDFVTNALEAPQQLNPLYFVNDQTGFSRIGRDISPAHVLPLPIRKNHEVLVDLKLSFRIVSGTNQSLGILDLEVAKSTQLSEVPIAPPE